MYLIDMRSKKVYELYDDPEAEFIRNDFENDCNAGLLYGEEPVECMIESYSQYWLDYLHGVIKWDIASLKMENELKWLRCSMCKYFKEHDVDIKSVKYNNYSSHVKYTQGIY